MQNKQPITSFQPQHHVALAAKLSKLGGYLYIQILPYGIAPIPALPDTAANEGTVIDGMSNLVW